jgi:tetratricopeptide (TPR) repeat protein
VFPDAAAWLNKGIIFQDLGDETEALDSFNRVLDLAPQDIEAWFRKGEVLQRTSHDRNHLPVSTGSLRLTEIMRKPG